MGAGTLSAAAKGWQRQPAPPHTHTMPQRPEASSPLWCSENYKKPAPPSTACFENSCAEVPTGLTFCAPHLRLASFLFIPQPPHTPPRSPLSPSHLSTPKTTHHTDEVFCLSSLSLSHSLAVFVCAQIPSFLELILSSTSTRLEEPLRQRKGSGLLCACLIAKSFNHRPPPALCVVEIYRISSSSGRAALPLSPHRPQCWCTPRNRVA